MYYFFGTQCISNLKCLASPVPEIEGVTNLNVGHVSLTMPPLCGSLSFVGQYLPRSTDEPNLKWLVLSIPLTGGSRIQKKLVMTLAKPFRGSLSFVCYYLLPAYQISNVCLCTSQRYEGFPNLKSQSCDHDHIVFFPTLSP